MKEKLLDLLACPSCGGDFLLAYAGQYEDKEIIDGVLTCKKCTREYKVVRGVPRFADLAKIATDLFGKSIQRQTLTDEELKAKVVARGAHESIARLALGFFIASRNGEFATVDPTLEQLLGRPLTSLRDVMAQKAKS